MTPLELEALRKRDYGHTFLSPSGEAVLADLQRFCRGFETCWDDDARRHLVLLGRQEVYFKIIHELNLSPAQLTILHGGGKFMPRPDQVQPDPDRGELYNA